MILQALNRAKFAALLSANLIAFSAQAQGPQESRLNVRPPANASVELSGYNSAPILKCPAVSEGEADLLRSLGELKDAIK